MLIQGLGCGFQNEATITALIQMPLDLTFHARRELPFQVPANQMDGVSTVHMSYFLRSGEGPTAQSFWGISCAKDRKSTRLNSSHVRISYAVFCLEKEKHIAHD